MTELEVLGQKTMELVSLNREYDSLLSLLARLKSGEVALANVEIDQGKRAWRICPQNADLGAIAPAIGQVIRRAPISRAAQAVLEAAGQGICLSNGSGKDYEENHDEEGI